MLTTECTYSLPYVDCPTTTPHTVSLGVLLSWSEALYFIPLHSLFCTQCYPFHFIHVAHSVLTPQHCCINPDNVSLQQLDPAPLYLTQVHVIQVRSCVRDLKLS